MAEPSEQDTIERLVEEFLRRYRRGERPLLTEYAEKHPEHAQEIRELFPALVVLERLGPQHEELQPAKEVTVQASPLERLGEYRVLREVGRGGMGVVYEAEQVSVGRHGAREVRPSRAVMDGNPLNRILRAAR